MSDWSSDVCSSDLRSASKKSAQLPPKRRSTLLSRAQVATSSGSVALSRSGPRKRKLRWKLPSLLSTTPGATSAAHGRWSASSAGFLRYSARFSIRATPSGEGGGPAPGRTAGRAWRRTPPACGRSEEHTSELQSLMRISYAVFCLKKKHTTHHTSHIHHNQK